MRGMRNAHDILAEDQKDRDSFTDLGIIGRIILKWVVVMLTGSISLSIDAIAGNFLRS
jgi:hypothetical protein